MHEVNTYINRYTKDAAYKESVRKLTDRITNMRETNALVSNYGQLMFDGPMKFKFAVDANYNSKAYLIGYAPSNFNSLLKPGRPRGLWLRQAPSLVA